MWLSINMITYLSLLADGDSIQIELNNYDN